MKRAAGHPCSPWCAARRGTRGKYYRDYAKGTNLVLLRPEIAEAFPTPEAVNEALQSLITSVPCYRERLLTGEPVRPPDGQQSAEAV
jgi:hypothetical protein